MSIRCYHCQLPIVGNVKYHAGIAGEQQPMCCPGCQAVAEMIAHGGLDHYYRMRSEAASQSIAQSDILLAELQLYDQDEQQAEFVTTFSPSHKEAQLLVDGITCAACVWLIESHLQRIEGISDVLVNLTRHSVRISWDPQHLPLSQILLSLRQIGYQAHPWHPDKQNALAHQQERSAIKRLAVAGIGMMQVMMYAIALYAGAFQGIDDTIRNLLRIASVLLTTPVVFYAAIPFFQSAWRALLCRQLNMDVPVSLAIGAAYSASLWSTFQDSGTVYFDSVCMFTFFLSLGRFLEMRVRHRTSQSTDLLRNVLPHCAEKKVGDDYCTVPLKQICPNDCIRIKPGQTVPADGIIEQGTSRLDESLLSGESEPVTRTVGEMIIGGSINIQHSLIVRITNIGTSSRLGTLSRLLEHAANDKPPMAQSADRVARYFVATVILISLTVYVGWCLFDADRAFWVMLSVLLVTCPCALSLATPTAFTAATCALHQNGVLIIKNHLLEGINRITEVVFDKTGTLTQGRPTITHVLALADLTKEQLLSIASAMELHSEHPIARAFSKSTQHHAADVQNVMGQGLSARIDGKPYRLGKPDFSAPNTTLTPPTPDNTWLLLSRSDQPVGWFCLEEALRMHAQDLVRDLKQRGIKVSLLSGDRIPVVAKVARTLGISEYHGAMSPENKLHILKQKQKNGHKVLMVGDGINDMLVLAAAHLSIAMGDNNDWIKTASDAVLINQDIGNLSQVFNTAKRTQRIIRQNLMWALAYNALALPLATIGWVAPWMAAIGMASSSLLVTVNSLRLNPKKTPKPHRFITKELSLS